MVKNTTGGNKHKGQARKFANPTNHRLRLSEDEAEVYSQVSKMLGNGMCHVSTLEGKKMLCMIRGKFRGRGKRDNMIKTGSWILVGMREWEENKTVDQLNKCDLLEVYSDLDKDKLKNTVNMNWKPFIENDSVFGNTDENNDEYVTFTNEDQEEYKKILEEQMTKGGTSSTTITMIIEEEEKEEEIDIDDI